MDRVGIAADELSRFAAGILRSLDVPDGDAALVADSLVAAELGWHPSHGMLRLPWYCARIRSGAMRAVTAPTIVSDHGAVLVLDGDDGIGQVLVAQACDEAVERAQNFGIAAVGVRNSNHFGTAGHWTRAMADRGCIGILMTNSSPAMAPWGGARKTLGSNPWSIAVPAPATGPVVLDLSNSTVARGKIYAAVQRDEPIPEGWALDESGHNTTDPAAALNGTLLPVGGHKGSGIAFMIDLLAGALTGSGSADAVVGPYSPQGRSRSGHLVIALQPDAFGDSHAFAERVSDLVVATTTGPTAPGFDRVRVPGEREAELESQGRRSGAQLPEKTRSELRALAESLNFEFTL